VNQRRSLASPAPRLRGLVPSGWAPHPGVGVVAMDDGAGHRYVDGGACPAMNVDVVVGSGPAGSDSADRRRGGRLRDLIGEAA
jgi:hypothetical protein